MNSFNVLQSQIPAHRPWISTMLQAAFHDDPIVGEEDESTLRFPNTQAERDTRDRLMQLANDALMLGDNKSWGHRPEDGEE
jgi:3'(2'), 5'-bisphosphate nucleotidase